MLPILDRQFIGRVDWTNPEKRIGGIKPQWREMAGQAYLEPVDASQFPDNGEVFWSVPPESVEVGSLWRFVAKENQKGPTIRQKYAAAFPTSADVITVADLRCLGQETVRRDLTESDRGLKIPFDLYGVIYLWIDENTWVGPVSLYFKDGRWFLASKDYAQPLRCVFPTNIDAILPIEKQRSSEQPSQLLFKPTLNFSRNGLIDWSDDEVLLRRVLRSGQILTQAQIEQLISALDASLLKDSSTPLERGRRKRASVLLENIKRNRRLAEEYANVFLKIPSVEKTISDEKSLMFARYKSQIEEETQNLREDISALDAEKTEIAQWIAEYSKERDRLQQEVEKATSEQTQVIATQVAEAEKLLAQRWDEFRSNAIPDLAEVEMMRVLMRNSVSSVSLPQAPDTNELTWNWPTAMATTHSTSKTFVDSLKKTITTSTLRSSGTAGRISRALTAAFLSGSLPVVCGDGARGTLEAFGNVAAGGRVLTLNVTPNYLDPSELCGGHLDNGWRREKKGLLDLLDTARQSQSRRDDQLFLVVLEGINRSPVEIYLSPIISIFRNRYSPYGHASLTLRGAEMINWPANVLLAATMCDGVARLTPGISFWSEAILLHLDSFRDDEDEESFPSYSPTSPLSEVSATQWRAWREKPREVSTEKCDEILLEGLRQNLGLRRELVPQSRFIWEYLNQLSSAHPEVLISQWMNLAFCAPIVSAGKANSALSWGSNLEEWKHCLDCVQQCMS